MGNVLRVHARLFRPGFRGVDALGFVGWSVSLLAHGREGLGAASPWVARAAVVTLEDPASSLDTRETVTFERDDGLAFVRETRWRVHFSDSLGGMREHVADPTERYHAALDPPLRFEMFEQADARGWARVLDVASRRSAVTRAIRERFRSDVANPARIPPWERERVLEEEVAAARRLCDHCPRRGDYRRALAARQRELREIAARATSREWEVARWKWPWSEGAPRARPVPAVRAARARLSKPEPESADTIIDPRSAWLDLPPRPGGSVVRLAEFLSALSRLYASLGRPPVWTSTAEATMDDPRWSELEFGLHHLRCGRGEIVWTSGDRVVRLSLALREAASLGMDPAPQEAGVWYELTALGLADGVVLEAKTGDDPCMKSFRLLGPPSQVNRVRVALEGVLES